MKIKPFQVAWGLLLFTLSVVLLLTTVEAVPWGIWLFVWQFWPMVFVIFGSSLLMKRRNVHFLPGMIIFIVIFLIFGGGLLLTWDTQYFNNQNFYNTDEKNIIENRISNELPQKTKDINVKMTLGAAEIKIDALSDEKSDLLYDGVHKSNFFNLNQKLDFFGDQAKLTLKTDPFIKRPFYSKSVNDISLNFSQKSEYIFDFESGASDIDINFEKLKVSKIKMDAGASKIVMKVGDKKDIDAEIKAGASSVKIYVPKNMGIKIDSKEVLTTNNFEEIGLIKKKNLWESKNLSEVKSSINLNFKTGASKVEIVLY